MQRPNLVFILIDDLGWRDLACYGSSFYETPHTDRLAAAGMRFTDAYASCPVCSPSRASLMTGKYPARVGITQFIGGKYEGRLRDVPSLWQLPLCETSIATALRAGGYQTWHVGKWHLGDRDTWPDRHGFEVNVAGCGWGSPRTYFSPWGIPTMAEGRPGAHLNDGLTDEAIRLIQDRDPARPFFLNLCHYAVHNPIQAPADLVAKYRAKAVRLGLDRQAAIAVGEPFPCSHKRRQRIERRLFQGDVDYAALVEHLDTAIGRLLAVLAREGLERDTLVVFTSDNGGLATSEGSPTCNLPLAEGKGWMYEGGCRVCQIARWPGVVEAGSVCATPTTGPDWYPTLLAAAGLPPMPRQHVDGVDLGPLLRGQVLDRGPIFWHYPHYSNQGDSPAGALRWNDWKLIEHYEDGRLRLFNLADDPGERRDLTAAEPRRVADLHARLSAWRQEVGARMPEINPDWQPDPLPAGVDPGQV